MGNEKDKLQLFGAAWCSKSAALRNFLQAEWIEFDDNDVEESKEAEEKVRALYDGKLKFPTAVYKGKFIKNPTVLEMQKFLKENNIE